MPVAKCTGEKFVMPSSIAVGNEAFADYLKVASLSGKERRQLFSKQSNQQKANFIKVNLAFQFVKRPDMTREQQEFVLDSISKVSADLYDKSSAEKVRQSELIGLDMENKALGLFSPKDLGDFIEPLMTNNEESVVLLQKYEDLLKSGMKARKKLAREMPVNERVNIWKTQLVYHLVTGKFSKLQNEFILNFLLNLSPKTFASRANLTKEEEVKALETIESSMLAVFSKPESYAIFMEIGIQKSVADDSNLAPAFCECRWYCSYGTCGASGCIMFPECGPTGSWDCTNVCNR